MTQVSHPLCKKKQGLVEELVGSSCEGVPSSGKEPWLSHKGVESCNFG